MDRRRIEMPRVEEDFGLTPSQVDYSSSNAVNEVLYRSYSEKARALEVPVTPQVNKFGWRVLASCRGSDPGLFFPVLEDGAEAEAAKGCCKGCPVIDDCLDYALNNKSLSGIWGGTTHKERRAIWRRNRKLAELSSA